MYITFPFGLKYDFGDLVGQLHKGVDLKTKCDDFPDGIGTPVYAPADGEWDGVGYDRLGGYFVKLKHKNNFVSIFYHLNDYVYKNGWTKLSMGDVIGHSGNSGANTTAPHLHWQVEHNGVPVDPFLYVGRGYLGSEIKAIARLLNDKIALYFE